MKPAPPTWQQLLAGRLHLDAAGEPVAIALCARLYWLETGRPGDSLLEAFRERARAAPAAPPSRRRR